MLFMHFVLKAIPYSLKNLKNDLDFFYNDLIQIDALIENYPSYVTYQEKLAALMFEQTNWVNICNGTCEQMSKSNNLNLSRNWCEARAEVGARLWPQIWGQVWNELNGDLREQIWAELWSSVTVKKNLLDWSKITDKIKENFGEFAYLFEGRYGKNSETLKSAALYYFMILQLDRISKIHTDPMRNILEHKNHGLIKFIKDRITEEQAKNIIESIELPEAAETNFLVRSELNIIKRYLPQYS